VNFVVLWHLTKVLSIRQSAQNQWTPQLEIHKSVLPPTIQYKDYVCALVLLI